MCNLMGENGKVDYIHFAMVYIMAMVRACATFVVGLECIDYLFKYG